MNPHELSAHKILSLARLPVPTLPHILSTKIYYQSRMIMSNVLWKYYNESDMLLVIVIFFVKSVEIVL